MNCHNLFSGEIWEGEMEVPMTKEPDVLIYKYVVHDGVNVTKDNWEFLEKDKTTNKHIHRFVDLGGKTRWSWGHPAAKNYMYQYFIKIYLS